MGGGLGGGNPTLATMLCRWLHLGVTLRSAGQMKLVWPPESGLGFCAVLAYGSMAILPYIPDQI